MKLNNPYIKEAKADAAVLQIKSMEAFEKMQFESDVYFKLAEAEREAEETGERFSSKDVLSAMKAAARGE